MELNVVKNAKKNIWVGTLNKLVVMLCPFAVRTVVQYVLGAHYLGLDSLFSSILAVLSLSEMGFSSAVAYNMYKPVAEGNTQKVNALLAFYKKAYHYIGGAIIALGLMVIPFLPKLISGEYPSGINLTLLYIIYVINASTSYFSMGYLSVIITVHQREDINSTVNSIVVIAQAVFRIAILVVTKNYYFYVLMLPLFTIVNNLWIGLTVKKQFPQYVCEGELTSDELGNIKRVVAGTFIQKACSVTRNSLDSICISFFLGLTLTAVYSNYLYISNAVSSLLGIVSLAFMGGIGNHVATKSVSDNFDELQKIDFIYLWVSGWFTACLLCLYQPFMNIWMGREMLLDSSVVVMICIYFYLLKLGDMRSIYNAANGLWWEQKWRSLAETAMNLSLNIVLGKFFGIYGIVLATIISLFVCNCLWSTILLFKHYYSLQYLKTHFCSQVVYTVVTLISCLVTYGLCHIFVADNDISTLFIRGIMCAFVPNIVYVVAYSRKRIFKETLKTIFGRGK